jgi:hypothetical protein
MNASNIFEYRGAFAAVLAAAIVGTSGLALDRGHTAHGPKAVIEIGELTPIDVLPQARLAELPEVIVSAPRLAMNDRPARKRV